MKYMTGNEIREKFLKFFQDRGHLMLPSASLIPQDDPTLLIIGAGMAPFKPFFTGKMKPPATRITTCQKCVRTGDIENVGRTARHHTYFEMLGNFSFGDYFKKEVIPWSWEFLTKELGLPADKLYITIHTEDDEAFDIWHNVVGVPEDHIVRLADNWWEIGSGPCGPDSEIHIDLGPERGCGKPTCGPGCDCDRFLEIWNLVFTQFNQMPDGTYPPLKNKNIDTGAGLERLASVVQGKPSNFETDLIFPIIEYAAKIANVEYGKDKATDVSLKVIADHVRSMTFMIGDGILPSNEGRGYVLRRILRRAIRHARLLGINEMFLTGAVDVVIGMFGHAYPNLVEKADFIKKVVEMEETSFLRTLKQGCELLNEEIEKLRAANKTVLDGATAFKLNDTFGFPWELTEEILEEAGMTMDKEGFDAALEVQRKMAREARNDKEGRPVVYNTSGFETQDTLRRLKGKVQIYLPDLKYSDDMAAIKYSNAPYYFRIATEAIKEMYNQVGDYHIDDNGIMTKGVIIRHLIMPGMPDNTKRIIDWVAANFKPRQVMFSLMHQYVPCGRANEYPEINRKVTDEEYKELENYLLQSTIEDGFVQEGDAACKDFIPCFDGTGV